MASSDPEIKDGFTLPVWMKTKPVKEFEPFARSPPPPEDSFFYISYPKDVSIGKPKLEQNVTKVISDQTSNLTTAATFSAIKEKDWSKHTKSCQEVLHGIAPINTAVNPVSAKPKPAGTNDDFKGEGAACGNSVVKVAQEMISGRPPRGFTVAAPQEEAAEAPPMHHQRLMSRRGSKSLPATPAHSPPGSPTSRRKKNNRYFASPFEPVEDAGSRSWLMTALLGYKKDLNTSTSTLAEEEALDTMLQGTLAESVENLGPAPKSRDPKLMSNAATADPSRITKVNKTHSFLPKPSELREMNFWSPTSM